MEGQRVAEVVGVGVGREQPMEMEVEADPANCVMPPLEDTAKGQQSYEELAAENRKLNQMLEQNLREVERKQESLLEENEQKRKLNQELKRRLAEQQALLEKSEKENQFLEQKLKGLLGGVQKVNQIFTQVSKEMEGGAGWRNIKELSSEAETLVATVGTQSRGLPEPSRTAEDSIGNDLVSKEVQQSAAATEPTPVSNPLAFPSEPTPVDNLRRSRRSSVLNKSFQIQSPATPVRGKNLSALFSEENPNQTVKHAFDTSRQSEGFYCICGISTTRKSDLIRHANLFNSKGEGQFVCPVEGCGLQYFTAQGLDKHVDTRHPHHRKNTESKGASSSKPTQSESCPPTPGSGSTPSVGRVVTCNGVTHAKDLSQWNPGGSTFSCLCGKKFKALQNFHSHMSYIARVSTRSSQANSSIMENDVSLAETATNSPQFPVPTFQFSQTLEAGRQLHGVLQSDPQTKTFRCFCGAQYVEWDSLRDHICIMAVFEKL